MRILRAKPGLLLVIGLVLIAGAQSCKKESVVVRKAALADTGVRVSTYAGSTQGYVDGPVSSAKFILASYLCMGPDKALYVADNNRLRKIDKNGNVSTVAGGQTIPPGGSAADGTGSQASFFQIDCMTITPTNVIYVTDGSFNPYLRTISLQGEVHTIGPRFGPNDVIISAGPDSILYGTGTDYSSVHVPVTINQMTLDGRFIGGEELPWNQSALAMIIGPDNAIYILVSTVAGNRLFKIANHKIYPPTTMSSSLPTLSRALASTNLNKPAKPVSLAQVGSVSYDGFRDALAVARDGTVYIAGSTQIWKLTPAGTLSVLIGTTTPGYVDGPAAQARFQQILAIELAQDDEVLYVSDNTRIRKVILK